MMTQWSKKYEILERIGQQKWRYYRGVINSYSKVPEINVFLFEDNFLYLALKHSSLLRG